MTTYARRPRTLLVAAALAVVLALLAVAALSWTRGTPTAVAQTTPPADDTPDVVRVQGTGTVTGRPDVMRLRLSVQARAEDPDGALQRMTRAYDDVRGALEAGGVEDPDVQTSDLSLWPVTKKGEGTIGYRASESLVASIRDLDRAGRLVTRVVAAGGTAVRLQGISFGIEEDGALLAEARDEAFAQARTKAQGYAKAAGRPLAEVVRVVEGGQPVAYGDEYAAFKVSAQSLDARIDRGSEQLSVDVTVDWAFGS